MIKAILFDFNGVIINDEPIQMEIYTEILKDEGIELSESDYYASLGMDDRTFVSAAYQRAGKTLEGNKVLELTQKKSEKWRERIASEPPIFEGVENFIRKSAQDMTLGIVSMARLEDIEFFLQTVGLRELFAVIVSANDITACKPDPQCYREGFRLIDAFRTASGHPPIIHGECLVIEDAPPGVLAAKANGLPVLGVTNTVSDSELRAAGADNVTKRLDDWMPESVRRAFA